MNQMYTQQVHPQHSNSIKILEFSAENIISDYEVLLRLVNTFTIDTDEYYPMCYKVNDAEDLKNLYFILRLLINHHIHKYNICRLSHLTRAVKIILIQCCVSQDLIRRISNYLCQQLGTVRIRGHPKRTSAHIWNSETTQNLKIYLYNYQKQKTAIFLATRHEKTIMACSYLIF